MQKTSVSDCVQLKVSENRMRVVMIPIHSCEFQPEFQDILDFLQSKNVTFGIKEVSISEILADFEHWLEPVIVAEGSKPIPGEPGFLKERAQAAKQKSPESDQKFVDLRSRTEILSVKKGERIADIIPPTDGVPGMTVDGVEVPAKPGKPLRLKQGRNTVINEEKNSIYATTDGQVSFQKKAVHVYPVYEVKGDLDLKTGNLEFVGNIHIFGDVPSGYKIQAEGDIRIDGIVEGSELRAGGSIYIKNGIAGQGRSLIQTENDLHTGYINQGNIKVGGDLHIHFLNHSNVLVEGNIYCQKGKGMIVGGNTTAGSNIYVNRLGTELMTKTAIYFGVAPELLNEWDKLSVQVQKDEESFNKLNRLKTAVDSKPTSQQTDKERILLLKVRNTHGQLVNSLQQNKDRLNELNDSISNVGDATLTIADRVQPGVEITFGKYKRKIQTVYESVEINLRSGEIVIGHL
ncbi:DUF342 domain-containing protein [Alkalihalobacillus sp. AL-G]|uniref:DUF342 domain-containing protein n=1 Tax=Alkalihalobacillus sp. AL-G TaxID=2926399 RepID=UPI00272BD8E6|nr:FapA family protein [Alkalihalobacillus sp. AL-G]WLD95179.1 FapA family protein [Alkalihalobacillus sp. AL-G]